MNISFVMPTRDRTQELAYSLGELGKIDSSQLGEYPELILVDNGSRLPPDVPTELANGIQIILIRLETNLGAGARNIGVERAKGDWIIMLDDDSHLCTSSQIQYLDSLDSHVGAVGGEIWLSDGTHEAGGLPEVVIGCGCAFRRELFLEIGGYDDRFGYYAEEYDLCAKMIAAGYEVRHSKSLQFEHRKSTTGRRMDEILYRLVRNNGWVIERYAPDRYREHAMSKMIERYQFIADRERAQDGFKRGAHELYQTLDQQSRTPMNEEQWDRFTGAHAVRQTLDLLHQRDGLRKLSVVGQSWGKGRETILRIAREMGFEIGDAGQPIVGTLSPGPMLDTKKAFEQAIACWSLDEQPESSEVGSTIA